MMKNLAGVENCDTYIQEELERAEIDMIGVPKSIGEVPFTLEGRLFTFGGVRLYRAWSYWVACGNIPLHIAEKLYDHPEGKRSVRAGGHAGCPPPIEEAKFFHRETGKPIIDQEYYAQLEDAYKSNPSYLERYKQDNEIMVFDKNTMKVAEPFVTSYHIDSQAGLLLYKLMVYC